MTSKLIKRLLIGISLFSLAACSGGSCSIGGHSEADCRMRGPRGAANACCRSSGSPCDGGLTCSTGLCTPCGGAGQPCCASGTCGAPSLACEFNGTTNGVCHACGHDGQTCCNGGLVSSFCVDGTSCTIATGTCGGAGTICSGPSTFHLGLEAANGCTAGDITISSTSLANALACANGMLSGTGRTAVPGSPTGIPNSFPYCEHETYGGFLPKTVVAWSQESADRCANATLTPGYYSASRGSCPLRAQPRGRGGFPGRPARSRPARLGRAMKPRRSSHHARGR